MLLYLYLSGDFKQALKPYMTKDINEVGDYLFTLYDDIIIPTELADVHYKSVIQKRNQWMIEESDLLVFYVRSPSYFIVSSENCFKP